MKKAVFLLVGVMFLALGVKRVWARPIITTTFYLWNTAPHNDNPAFNDPKYWVYDPPIMDGSNNEAFWKRNLEDLAGVGIDGAFLVTYSEVDPRTMKPSGLFKDETSHKYVKIGIETAEKYDIPIKFGAFADLPAQKMDINQMFEWNYTRDIKSFFQMVPKKRWLTHNNLPVEQGGRPMIMYWTMNVTSEVATEHLKQVKEAFKKDFGVEPFVAVERETAAKISEQGKMDGIYRWSSTIGGYFSQNLRGYKIESVGVGDNEELIRPWRCYAGMNPTDTDRTFRPRILINPNRWGVNEIEEFSKKYPGEVMDEAGFFRNEFRKTDDNANMIFIQDFNEFGEGSTWSRAVNFPTKDNPLMTKCAEGYSFDVDSTINGQRIDQLRERYKNEMASNKKLPEDYYLKAVREEIVKKFPDIGCAKPNPPMGATMTCSGNQITVKWQTPGGEINDYPIRITKDGKKFLNEPDDSGQFIKGAEFSFKADSEGKYSGFIQSRRKCPAPIYEVWSEAATIVGCSVGGAIPDNSCTKPNPPVGVTMTCKGNQITVKWQAPGGIINDYPIRIKKDGKKLFYEPDDSGKFIYGTEYSFTAPADGKYDGFVQSRRTCPAPVFEKWSEAATITGCMVGAGVRSCDSCANRKNGDANCDGKVDMSDFGIWKDEYLKKIMTKADFNCDNKADMTDFGVWKRGYLGK